MITSQPIMPTIAEVAGVGEEGRARRGLGHSAHAGHCREQAGGHDPAFIAAVHRREGSADDGAFLAPPAVITRRLPPLGSSKPSG